VNMVSPSELSETTRSFEPSGANSTEAHPASCESRSPTRCTSPVCTFTRKMPCSGPNTRAPKEISVPSDDQSMATPDSMPGTSSRRFVPSAFITTRFEPQERGKVHDLMKAMCVPSGDTTGETSEAREVVRG
jgi:hypothetical protein